MNALPILTDAELTRIQGLDDPTKSDPDSGFGMLRTSRGGLPLAALDVQARLEGLVSSVEIAQTFVNVHSEPLEATYIFPLPDRAAVTRFRLEVAGRVIEGDLQERQKARKTYDEAIQTGHRAAIAEEERPGVFTLRVGNLPPGERAVVQLTLVGPLPYVDGQVTFRFPLVVAPRYIPGTPLPGPNVGAGISQDTSEVPDASRISPPVLLPGFASPVALSLTVEIHGLSGAGSIRSSLHTVQEEHRGNNRRYRLYPGERLDRDFILRYCLGQDQIHSSLVVQPDKTGEEGTFLLALLPGGVVQQRPREVVFVLDRSGSMAGWKMVAARRAVARMVETLTQDDRFTVYAFDDTVITPPGFDGVALVPATEHHRFRATEFLSTLEARGGTEMARPLVQAMTELDRPGRQGDRLLVLITDGQVGNEDQIVQQIGERCRGQRIFTLGIDRAVNAAFLRRLADLGGGTSEVVESDSRLDEVMERINRLTGTPLLTELSLRPAGLEVSMDSVVPARLPDLFAGAPVMILGRYSRGSATGGIGLSARQGDRPWKAELRTVTTEGSPQAQLWARGRIRDLEDRYAIGDRDRAKLEHEIVQTSLRFGVLSRFTAFVAVDRSEIVNSGGKQKEMLQPVELPSGWASPGDALAAQAMPAAAGGAMRCLGAMPRGLVKGYSGPVDQDEEMANLCMTAVPKLMPRSPAEPEGAGLMERLVGAVFGKKAKSSAPGKARTSLRELAERMVERMKAVTVADAESCRTNLQAIVNELTAFLQACLAEGEGETKTHRLTELTQELQQMLKGKGPAAARFATLHQEILAELNGWVSPPTPAPTGGAPPRREGFWK